MNPLQRSLAIVLIFLHLLWGAIVVLIRFPGSARNWREHLISSWSAQMLRYCGIVAEFSAPPDLGDRGFMLILNHVSWIDVYVVNAYRATSFVAKAEIRGWPLIGWLCQSAETIFIERDRRRALHGVLEQMQRVLLGGGVVGVFPEGTTTDGTIVLPFHSNLLQAACASEVPIVTASIRYFDRHGQRSYAAGYIGNMSLWESLMHILVAAPITARLTFLGTVDSAGGRREVAQQAQDRIAASLALP